MDIPASEAVFLNPRMALLMLLLTPIAEHHLADVQVYASDPAIGATSTVPTPYPEDGAISWYSRMTNRISAGHAAVFAMVEDSAFRGVIGINDIDHETRRAHLDYWVAVAHQGRGIASRAVALALDYAATELKLKAMLSACLATNAASIRVLQRNGFIERSRTLIPEGKFQGQELLRQHRALSTPPSHA
ncbi:GNAT family N-acetyltransferase [Dyella choica]|uniref:N-acetyltransferase n=1 Tax=Dyella choica TaxID=1927959 RepID=A0A3S0RXJ0_9GAMM|nr:GNAT family N-acetyltransferase [Dyella choica]RUL70899.1 N-acetyltransferase [Dyella choica]